MPFQLDGSLACALLFLAVQEPGPFVADLEKPERWWLDAHWRCRNDHVEATFRESLRGPGCRICWAQVFLTFPEDKPGPLDHRNHPTSRLEALFDE